jgi:hypothetical protein
VFVGCQNISRIFLNFFEPLEHFSVLKMILCSFQKYKNFKIEFIQFFGKSNSSLQIHSWLPLILEHKMVYLDSIYNPTIARWSSSFFLTLSTTPTRNFSASIHISEQPRIFPWPTWRELHHSASDPSIGSPIHRQSAKKLRCPTTAWDRRVWLEGKLMIG